MRFELRGNAVHLGARLLQRDAVFQACDRENPRVPAAIFRQCRGPRFKRHIRIGGLKQLEIGGHHANDRVWSIVQLKNLSDRLLPGKSTLSEAVTEHHDALGSAPIVGTAECPAVVD